MDYDKSETDDNPPVPDYLEARKFLFANEAYQRLQERIQVASTLTSRKGEIVQVIRDTILGVLTTHNPRPGQKKTAPVLQSIEIMISWDPIDFLTTQYGYSDSTAFKEVIVLIGDTIDAQATTCGLYATQLWP